MADITTIANAGWVKKRSRIMKHTLAWPVSGPPYNGHTGYPEITASTEVVIVGEYSISEQSSLSADKLTLTAAIGASGRWIDYFDYNDIVTVEEYYENSVGASGWIMLGTFMLEEGEPSVSATARSQSLSMLSTMRRLNINPINKRFEADRIFVARRRLTPVEWPTRDPENPVSYYKFVDGDAITHTYNWATTPVPKCFVHTGTVSGTTPSTDPERLHVRDGSVDLLYGEGAIYIDKDYYENSEDDGGLGMSTDVENAGGIDAEYYYLATEADVAGALLSDPWAVDTASPVAITSITQDSDGRWLLGISGATLKTLWKGTTLSILTGSARHSMYKIADIDTGAGKLVLSERYTLTADGVTTGDNIKIVSTNRMEDVLRQLFVSGGFQDEYPNKPFYISSIAPLGYILNCPTSSDFNFAYSDGIKEQGVIERLVPQLPPNYMVFNGTDGSLSTGYVQQLAKSDANTLPINLVMSAGTKRNLEDVYTKIRYTLRNREYKNIASSANGSLAYVAVPDANAADGTPDKLLYDYNVALDSQHKAGGSLFGQYLQCTVAQAKKRITDGSADTQAVWYCEDAGDDGYKFWNGLFLCELKFTEPHVLGEIHFVPTQDHLGEIIELLYSADGNVWDTLTDEVKCTSTQPLVFNSDMPKDTVQYLRVRLVQPAWWNNQPFLSGTQHRTYASIADIKVYASDIEEVYTELGVDRFDVSGYVAGKGTATIRTTMPPEASWIGKKACVTTDTTVRTYTITGYSVVENTYTIEVTPAVDSDVVVGANIVIEEGESDADFALDVKERERLGVRLYSVPEVDEYGYYTARRLYPDDDIKTALQKYGKLQGKAYLAEKQQAYQPETLEAFRPDVHARKTIIASIPDLGIYDEVFLISEVARDSKGVQSITATAYASTGWAL